MAFTPKSASPPAYKQLSSDAAMQIFFGRIQAAVNAKYGNPTQESNETKRLRNFMLYCLAIDYRWPCPLSLSASDRVHFMAMWDILLPTPRIHLRMHLGADERRALAPYFWKYLYEPCAELGIPVESAVATVYRHSKYLNAAGRYKGCVHGLLHSRGFKVLASKLFMDRSVLVPRLVTSHQMRGELLDNITQTARLYFLSISGYDSAIFRLESDPTTAFTEEAGCQYELTPRGEHYQNNRDQTLNMVQPTVRPLLEKARECISRLTDRHTVFPKVKDVRSLCDQTCMGPGPTPTAPPEESPIWAEPPLCRDVESLFMQDLFEHRPGRGPCDS
jgi:hypothetical protein